MALFIKTIEIWRRIEKLMMKCTAKLVVAKIIEGDATRRKMLYASIAETQMLKPHTVVVASKA